MTQIIISLKKTQLRFRGDCSNYYKDITYNYTYLYYMKIGSDFHFFNVILFAIKIYLIWFIGTLLSNYSV